MYACLPSRISATGLSRDLHARALVYARRNHLLHDCTPGSFPSTLFGRDEHGRHGNFEVASDRAIDAHPLWRKRLEKPHTASRRGFPRSVWRWRELDCAASSDALLMNIFCHPYLLQSRAVCGLLGVRPGSEPCFGVHPRLARERNLRDTTEVDMQMDDLLLEAKLTEGHFQTARPSLMDRFPGWKELFDEPSLPRSAAGAYLGYQLLRGILAAHTLGLRFGVLIDGRRHDHVEQWHRVVACVHSAELRCRLTLLTWQELSAATPAPLQHFLAEKYGINP